MVAVLVSDNPSLSGPNLYQPGSDGPSLHGLSLHDPTFDRPGPQRRPGAPAGRTVGRREAPQIYRRRRVAVFGSLVIVVVAGWLAVASLLGPGSAHPLGPTQAIAARSWVVQPGDTLWSIAVSSGATGDIRPLVDRLSAEVHGQPLQPGEVIRLP